MLQAVRSYVLFVLYYVKFSPKEGRPRWRVDYFKRSVSQEYVKRPIGKECLGLWRFGRQPIDDRYQGVAPASPGSDILYYNVDRCSGPMAFTQVRLYDL
jgi:hypothetical protein